MNQSIFLNFESPLLMMNALFSKHRFTNSFIIIISVAVTLAQVWTHYKIGKLNIWTMFYNVCVNFLNNQIWKEIMFQLNGKLSSVTTFSTNFSFQDLVFSNSFIQEQKSLQNQYLPHFESKSYQINSIKSYSSRSSQQH
jgi:hypothetical protein